MQYFKKSEVEITTPIIKVWYKEFKKGPKQFLKEVHSSLSRPHTCISRRRGRIPTAIRHLLFILHEFGSCKSAEVPPIIALEVGAYGEQAQNVIVMFSQFIQLGFLRVEFVSWREGSTGVTWPLTT